MFKTLKQKIEAKRDSKNLLWKAVVLGKDFAWKMLYGTAENEIRINASSSCQLECPVCQQWAFRKTIGKGYLKFKDFKKFVDAITKFTNIDIAH